MTSARYFVLAPALAACLLGATHATAPIGFVDLPRLLATHPLHEVLARYDREIAALRSTQTIGGLTDAAAQTQRSAADLRRAAATAQSRVDHIAASGAGRYRQMESNALGIFGSPSAGNRAIALYRDELVRETNANLAAFERAMAQRAQRAYDARQQQLREKELTLAFDLARKSGGQRLALMLKIEDLHLDKGARDKLLAALSALKGAQVRAVTAMHRADLAALARYRDLLRSDAARSNAQMAVELRSKALANLSLRRGVSQPDSQIGAFRASYRFESDAAALSSGLNAASRDLSQRFARLASADRTSRRETAVQIASLQADRKALYHAMVAQIMLDARRLAKIRHLGTIAWGTRPHGSVDLTAAVNADLATNS